MLRAEGVCVVRGADVASHGSCPRGKRLSRVLGWLAELDPLQRSGVWSTDDEPTRLRDALSVSWRVPSILALALDDDARELVVWFRDGAQLWGHEALRAARELRSSLLSIGDLQRAHGQRVRDLNHAYDELHHVGRVVAHDLKSPLRNLRSLVDWLKEDHGESLEQPVLDIVQAIDQRTRRMRTVVDGILRFSEARTQDVQLKLIDTRLLLLDVLDCAPAPTHLTVELDPDLPHLVYAEHQLRQVFTHLLANAYEHAESSVRVVARDEGGTWALCVLDDGPGIPPDVRARAFDLFVSSAESDTPRGLGLALVRKLVRGLGGSVWFGSPARGTEVWFSVEKQPELPERRTARRVLIVEDDEETADMLGLVLNRLGHECSIANSATQAVELVRGGPQPEVAVVDLNLPDRSGYELVAELRELSPQTNYIALTGQTGGRTRLLAKDAGFDFFTQKPANIDLLNALIT